jgi:hypothetical protein
MLLTNFSSYDIMFMTMFIALDLTLSLDGKTSCRRQSTGEIEISCEK